MKTDAAFKKGIDVLAIENEKKRAEKEVKFLKKELWKAHPELLFVWEEALKVYNLIISRYPHIFNNRDFGERVLQNVRYLNEGFPLLTTKKVFFRGVLVELLWFISGETNIQPLVKQNVHIWDEWPFEKYKNRTIKVVK